MSSVLRAERRARDDAEEAEVAPTGPPSFSDALAEGLDARGLGRWALVLGLVGTGLVGWTVLLVRPGNVGVVVCFGAVAAVVVTATVAALICWFGRPDRALDDLVPGASRIVPGIRGGAAALAGTARRAAAARRRWWSPEPARPPESPEPRAVVVAKEPTGAVPERPMPPPDVAGPAPVSVTAPASGPATPADDETRPLPSPRRRVAPAEDVGTAPIPAEPTAPEPPADDPTPAPPETLPSSSETAAPPSGVGRRPSSRSGPASSRGDAAGKRQGKGRKPSRRVAGRGRPDGS